MATREPPIPRGNDAHGEHLLPTTRRWPDTTEGPWLLVFSWQSLSGRAECTGLEIRSTMRWNESLSRFGEKEILPEVGMPLTTTVLRSLNFGEMVAEERVKAQRTIDVWVSHTDPTPQVPANMRDATRRRLELAATVYKKVWRQGGSPTAAVAAELGITGRAAANLVMRARAAGLLPPTSPGAPQG